MSLLSDSLLAPARQVLIAVWFSALVPRCCFDDLSLGIDTFRLVESFVGYYAIIKWGLFSRGVHYISCVKRRLDMNIGGPRASRLQLSTVRQVPHPELCNLSYCVNDAVPQRHKFGQTPALSSCILP